jgi:hypothetical protein
MPLTDKGREIMAAMKKEYGEEKGERVFYASANKGKITGVHDQAPPVKAAPYPNTRRPAFDAAVAALDAVTKRFDELCERTDFGRRLDFGGTYSDSWDDWGTRMHPVQKRAEEHGFSQQNATHPNWLSRHRESGETLHGRRGSEQWTHKTSAGATIKKGTGANTFSTHMRRHEDQRTDFGGTYSGFTPPAMDDRSMNFPARRRRDQGYGRQYGDPGRYDDDISASGARKAARALERKGDPYRKSDDDVGAHGMSHAVGGPRAKIDASRTAKAPEFEQPARRRASRLDADDDHVVHEVLARDRRHRD